MKKHKTLTVSKRKRRTKTGDAPTFEMVEVKRYKSSLSTVLEFMRDTDESIQKIPLSDYTQHLIKGLDDSLIHADIDLVEIINMLLIFADIDQHINQKLSDLQKFITSRSQENRDYPDERRNKQNSEK